LLVVCEVVCCGVVGKSESRLPVGLSGSGWMDLASRVRSIRIEGTITQDKMLVHGTNDEMSGDARLSVDMRDIYVG
jgi:hypothetical protein